MDPISPNLPISITLEAQEWNTVLDVLANGPFRVVSPIIQKLAAQAQGAAAAEEVQQTPRSTNGAGLALGGG